MQYQNVIKCKKDKFSISDTTKTVISVVTSKNGLQPTTIISELSTCATSYYTN